MTLQVATVVPLLNRLQERVRRLESEIVALKTDLQQVTVMLGRPVATYEVATYEVDGEQIVVTEADVEAIKAQLVRPHAKESIRQLALINKLTERERNLPEDEIRRLIANDIEAIRAEAIAKGIAIDDPLEAVEDD